MNAPGGSQSLPASKHMYMTGVVETLMFQIHLLLHPAPCHTVTVNLFFFRFSEHAASCRECPKKVDTVRVPVVTMNFTKKKYTANISDGRRKVTSERVWLQHQSH